MASIKLLDPPDYSGDERQALIDFVLSPQEVAHSGLPEAGRATQVRHEGGPARETSRSSRWR